MTGTALILGDGGVVERAEEIRARCGVAGGGGVRMQAGVVTIVVIVGPLVIR